ncbi:MAG: terminase small subunit [Nocardioidaceae bacterium]
MSVVEATEASIRAAKHLSPMDAGAVEALRVLAVKLDELDESGRFDNVAIPTFLKFCESLGLTPAGRVRLDDVRKQQPTGKLAQLRSAAAVRG